MYSKFVFYDKLVSPINGYSLKSLVNNKNSIKLFGFDSLKDLEDKFPGFPHRCPHSQKIFFENKEKAKKSCIKSHDEIVKKYNKNPKFCTNCSTPLSYKKRGNIFCSKSCSATYQNPSFNISDQKKLKYKLQKESTILKKMEEKNKKINFLENNNILLISKSSMSKKKILSNFFNIPIKDLNDDHYLFYSEKLYHYSKELLMSPEEIRKVLDPTNSRKYFADVLKMFKIPARSREEMIYNNQLKSNSTKSDKDKYWSKCKFTFNPYSLPVLGSELLKNYKFLPYDVKGINDLSSFLHRDHRFSISMGFKLDIDPYFISHPANCEILFFYQNTKKANKCSITVERLYQDVREWNSIHGLY